MFFHDLLYYNRPSLKMHCENVSEKEPIFVNEGVADSNYRGKCDIGGFLIFEWTLLSLRFFITKSATFITICKK
jgi:hypothetical protein